MASIWTDVFVMGYSDGFRTKVTPIFKNPIASIVAPFDAHKSPIKARLKG
jgi:hypothetical protein